MYPGSIDKIGFNVFWEHHSIILIYFKFNSTCDGIDISEMLLVCWSHPYDSINIGLLIKESIQ